jgi:MFS family permease
MTVNQPLQPIFSRPTTWTINLNTIAAATIAGLVSGVMAGLLARLAMRVAALLAGEPPEFSVTGTVGIAVLFALLGVVLALIFLAIRAVIPQWRVSSGLVYGAILAGVVAWLFFLNQEGELGIISPWVSAALFSPILLIYGVMMNGLLWRFEQRQTTARPVPAFWFCALAGAFIFAIVRMVGALGGGYLRTPPAIQQLYTRLGVAYGEIGDAHTLLGLLFVLIYSGLCASLFWRGYRRRAARISTIGLLLFGGLLLPAGALAPRTMTDAPGSGLEWLIWSLALVGLFACWFFARRWANRQKDPVVHQTIAWLSVAIGLSLGGFLLMWLAILLIPGLQLRRLSGFHAAFATPLYLWPWLLCPLALLIRSDRSAPLAQEGDDDRWAVFDAQNAVQ